jgi:hypothetical protein
VLVAFSLPNDTTSPDYLKSRMPASALVAAGLAAGFGLLAGAFVGLRRVPRDHGTTSLVLGLGGAVIGGIGGGLFIPAIAVSDSWLHPLVSSSLAWAFAGLLAGLGGYDLSRELAERAEAIEGEEDGDQPRPRLMWVLRESKRSLREWPLYRVLPVLAVSAFSLVGAAILAPASVALALLAIGLLGLAVGVVLHDQEKRLRRLERRFCGRE